jgi:phosphatidylserine synthase
MIKTTPQQETKNELNRRRTNLRDGLAVAVILFISLLIGSTPQSNPGHPSTRDFAWVAVTYVGILGLILVSYLNYRRADERQQLVQLKAAAFTFPIVLLGLFTAEMLYSLKQINLNPVVQILFIGSIIVWILMQKLIERQNR